MSPAADNADDLAPGSFVGGVLDAWPGGVGKASIPFGHRLVDDSHHRRALVIRVRKLAPLEQRNTHYPKIVRGDRTELGNWHAWAALFLAVHENAKGLVARG